MDHIIQAGGQWGGDPWLAESLQIHEHKQTALTTTWTSTVGRGCPSFHRRVNKTALTPCFATTRLTRRRSWLHTSCAWVQSQVNLEVEKSCSGTGFSPPTLSRFYRVLPHQRSKFIHHPEADTSGLYLSVPQDNKDQPTSLVMRPRDVTSWLMNRPIM